MDFTAVLGYVRESAVAIYGYLLRKYHLYLMWQDIVQNDDPNTLSKLQLAVRAVKHSERRPVRTGETFMESCHDLTKFVLGADGQEEAERYCMYAPGLIFKQHSDGIHVHIKNDEKPCVLMSSLSYWGFHANQEVLEYAIQKARETGVGNHASYLVVGKNTVCEELYDEFKKFYNRRYAAISASGFLGCMNLVNFLVRQGSVVFMDKEAHICLQYGAKLSGAKMIKFPHNDYDELENLLHSIRSSYTKAILVLDAIYSADGSIADLPRARALCDKYDVLLVMDEAHSLGSLGPTGRGIEEHYDMLGSCDYICGVFSKSLASYGGFVVSDHANTQDLNVSPGVGFATGPHAFSAASVTRALQIIQRDGHEVRPKMEALRKFFVDKLRRTGLTSIRDIGHDVFIEFRGNLTASAVAIDMRKRGYLISAFMFPSIPLNKSIIRLTVNPLITEEIIDDFCDALCLSLRQVNIKFPCSK